MARKWAYKTITLKHDQLERDEYLTGLGHEGWEIISIRMISVMCFVVYLKLEL